MNTRAVSLVGEPRFGGPRQMTPEQLLHLGCRRLFYVRAGMCDGAVRFVLFGADGRPLAETDNVEAAFELAAERGLEFVSVH
jgi:hypothetical protein